MTFEDFAIGIHLCPICEEKMVRCYDPLRGWVKYICRFCNLIVPVFDVYDNRNEGRIIHRYSSVLPL